MKLKEGYVTFDNAGNWVASMNADEVMNIEWKDSEIVTIAKKFTITIPDEEATDDGHIPKGHHIYETLDGIEIRKNEETP